MTLWPLYTIMVSKKSIHGKMRLPTRRFAAGFGVRSSKAAVACGSVMVISAVWTPRPRRLLCAFSNPALHIKVLNRTLRFLLNFNPVQVRYVGSMLRRLLEHVATGRLFTPLVSVEAIATALLRIDPTGTMFTSTHLTLVKCAYHSSWIEPALKVLDRDITFYPGMAGQKDSRLLCDSTLAPTSYISTETGLTDQIRSATVLEYNLVSALCYISRRDWTKAQRALERVITHPSKDKGVSKMMDEAYKKWLLVSLLKDGAASDVPAYTPLPAKNAYSALGTAYRNVPASRRAEDKGDVCVLPCFTESSIADKPL
ncbi:hypothetical protein FALCPG4_014301 [Fusarium falciforme]